MPEDMRSEMNARIKADIERRRKQRAEEEEAAAKEAERFMERFGDK